MVLKFRRENYIINGKRHYTRHREILDGKNIIGCISFVRENRKIYLMYVEIYNEYRGKGYGDKVIETLLNYKNVDCIIGEALVGSRGFWHKMIRKYNGSRRNFTYFDNTSSAFTIPKNNITNDEMYDIFDKWERNLYGGYVFR